MNSVLYSQSTSNDSLSTKDVRKIISHLHKTKQIFPVIIEGDSVFNIFEKANAESLSAHAKLCKKRVEALLLYDVYNSDYLAVKDSSEYLLITYKDSTIVEFSSITVGLLHANKSLITRKYIEKINNYFSDNQPDRIKNKIFEVLKLLAIYLVFLFVIIQLHKYAKKWIINNNNFFYKLTRLLRIRNVEEEQKENATEGFLKFVKWIFAIIIALYTYASLPAILDVFYFTRAKGRLMISYIVDPFLTFSYAFIDYIPTMINIAVIIFIFRIFIKLINYFFGELEEGNVKISGFYKEWASPTSKLVKLVLYAFLLTIIFPLLPGSGSDVFKGVTMFLGLLLSLGSTSVISNALSGLIMTYMRPFKIGDRIEVDLVTGIVVQKNLLITRVRTPKNVIITIPNAKVLSGHSKNYSTAAERSNLIIHVSITIGYDVDWRVVHKLLLSASKKTNGVLEKSGKESFVLQKSLDDYYVEYELNAYTSQAEKYIVIQSELNKNILDEFNNEGVEILSPHYRSNRMGDDITAHKVPVEKEIEDDIENKEESELDINEKISLRAKEIEDKKDEAKN